MSLPMLSTLLSFEEMVAIRVIKLVYWLGLGLAGLAVLVSLVSGLGRLGHDPGGGLGAIVLALVAAFLGVLVWRIVCESMIIAFGIYDRLGEIRDELKRRAVA